MAQDSTLMSPILADTILPTDGVPIVQPPDRNPPDTVSSPVIPDKDLFLIMKNSTVMTTDNPNQTISGTFSFGNGWLVIDTVNKRLLIHDGKTYRILIGKY